MLTNGLIIVVITLIIVVLWQVVSYHQTQQALVWWDSRQWMRMSQEAEAIRNSLLQDSFFLRRSIELSLACKSENFHLQEQDYLATIEKFHHSLKDLSNYLFPVHIDDSLPLAIRYLLESWQLRFPRLSLEMELEYDLQPQPHHLSRIVLLALEELLQITCANISSSLSIFVSLKAQGSSYELKVCLYHFNVSKLTKFHNSLELDHLRLAFQFLTSGKCWHQGEDNKDTWYFLWYNMQKTSMGEKNSSWKY